MQQFRVYSIVLIDMNGNANIAYILFYESPVMSRIASVRCGKTFMSARKGRQAMGPFLL